MRNFGVLFLLCWLSSSLHTAVADVPVPHEALPPRIAALVERMPATETRRRIETSVPRRGDRALHLRDVASGIGLRATLRGAAPTLATSHGTSTLYRAPLGAGSSRVVRREPRGLEDLIELTRRPAEEIAVYEVVATDAAGARVVGRTLELLDRAGVPRLRMAPPWLLDATGRRIEIDVRVSGCHHDIDPRSPIGRPVTAPEAPCEVTLDWSDREARYPLVIDPSWTATDSLATARREMAIGYLASTDDVIVAGGTGIGELSAVNALTSVELYDVGSETFAAGMPLASERARPSFAVLADDRFLVVGGARSGSGSAPTVVAGTEIFDGVTATWTPVAGPTSPRVWSEALRLADGHVLLAGGKTDHYFSDTTSASAELFDPATATWSPAGTMTAPRYGNFALLPLPGGRVLMAGGFDASDTPETTSIYTVASNSWAPGAPMTMGRGTGLSAALPSGDVILAGGSAYVASVFSSTDTTEIYRAATNEWRSAGAIGAPVDYRTNGAVVRSDGIVIAPAGIGARGLYSEAFDPGTETWATGCDPTRAALVAVGAVVLPDERALVVGGQDGTGILASAWLSGPEPAACDDGNPCTDDACDDALGCTSTPRTGSCDDGDACTMDDVCEDGGCAGAPILGCGIDAGEPDAGETDAGALDAGEGDAGEADGGRGDAGGSDAGARDAGLDGGGATDAGNVVGSTGGCGCRARRRDDTAGWVAMAIAIAVVRARRRR
jgi:hypothetical protein